MIASFFSVTTSTFAKTCPAISTIDKDEKRFSTTKDLLLKACYIDCDNTSVDAWEMAYCGSDCEKNCTSTIFEEKLSSCFDKCDETSVDAWEMVYCKISCEEKFKIK